MIIQGITIDKFGIRNTVVRLSDYWTAFRAPNAYYVWALKIPKKDNYIATIYSIQVIIPYAKCPYFFTFKNVLAPDFYAVLKCTFHTNLLG